MMLRSRLLVLFAAAALVADCGRPEETAGEACCTDTGDACEVNADCDNGYCVPCDEAGFFLVLNPMVLSRNNSLAFVTYPGNVVQLKVVLLRSAGADIDDARDLTPVSSEVISWKISGPAVEARLSHQTSLTNSSGIATIAVDVGNIGGVTFQVHASTPGTETVVFSFQVKLDQRELRILSPSIVDTVVNYTERLRVQLMRPTGGGRGTPISGESLRVELRDGIRNQARLEPVPGDVVEIHTDLTGIATVRFETGVAAGEYEIIFCGSMSCPGVSQQVITVNVDLRGSSGECERFTDCEPGDVCVNGVCVLAATYCAKAEDCPDGYHCGRDSACHLGASLCIEENDCDAGFTCVNQNCVECTLDRDCGRGFFCNPDGFCIREDACDDCAIGWTCAPGTGVCVPPANPNAVIDVSGTWSTRYMLDISDTLPPFFTEVLAPIVDFLDLLFRSQLEIDILILGDILEAMLDVVIDEYVPDWVHTVVIVLGDFIHLFEHMLVDGKLELYQPGSPYNPGLAVSAEEDWESARFFIASLCPGGILDFEQAPIPYCGEVDVIFDPTIDIDYSNNDPEVGVTIQPFAGQVEGEWLHLYNRDVDVALRQLVNVLLDVIVAAASNGQWYDFEELLLDIIPCADLQSAVDDLACDLTDASVCSIPIIGAICDAAANAAVASLTDALGALAMKLELDFDQSALIYHDNDPAQPVAIQLGSLIDPEDASDIVGATELLGTLDGSFDQNSWWYGLGYGMDYEGYGEE